MYSIQKVLSRSSSSAHVFAAAGGHFAARSGAAAPRSKSGRPLLAGFSLACPAERLQVLLLDFRAHSLLQNVGQNRSLLFKVFPDFFHRFRTRKQEIQSLLVARIVRRVKKGFTMTSSAIFRL